MIHRLLGRQLGDRRQDPEGIRGQHYDIAGMLGDTRARGVRNELQRIGAPRILGEVRIVEVEGTGFMIDDDILQNAAEAPCRREDFGLRLRRQSDHLGIAAALEVEDPVGAPAVLVIADQEPFRIGRERRLAGAGKAEEDSGSAVIADVDGAVHRQDAALGQEIIKDTENRLLDLARIA